jgi:hypothetical protein
MSRQHRRYPDEALRRECRMNGDRFASLLFCHNRSTAGTVPAAAHRFLHRPSADPTALQPKRKPKQPAGSFGLRTSGSGRAAGWRAPEDQLSRTTPSRRANIIRRSERY